MVGRWNTIKKIIYKNNCHKILNVAIFGRAIEENRFGIPVASKGNLKLHLFITWNSEKIARNVSQENY